MTTEDNNDPNNKEESADTTKEEDEEKEEDVSSIKTMKIISMGLPKTGTTATAVALQEQLGLKVAHNMGDKLNGNKCNVIINTLEHKYDDLYYKYPNAKWIVTYSKNVTEWIDSVQYHNKQPNKNRDHIPCKFYGCDKGILGGPTTITTTTATATISKQQEKIKKQRIKEEKVLVSMDDDQKLKELYDRYYDGLFVFLDFHQVQYAYVDVRANDYRNLKLIHPNLHSPFISKNTRDKRGQFPKCK